jgi:hypothetical protein
MKQWKLMAIKFQFTYLVPPSLPSRYLPSFLTPPYLLSHQTPTFLSNTSLPTFLVHRYLPSSTPLLPTYLPSFLTLPLPPPYLKCCNFPQSSSLHYSFNILVFSLPLPSRLRVTGQKFRVKIHGELS